MFYSIYHALFNSRPWLPFGPFSFELSASVLLILFASLLPRPCAGTLRVGSTTPLDIALKGLLFAGNCIKNKVRKFYRRLVDQAMHTATPHLEKQEEVRELHSENGRNAQER